MTARPVVSVALAVAVGALAFGMLGADERDRGGERSERPAAAAGWSDEGRRVFAAMGCGSCHRLSAAGATGRLAPNLDDALSGHDRASLIASIVRVPGERPTMMPDDYGARMTDAELAALVSFLLDSR